MLIGVAPGELVEAIEQRPRLGDALLDVCLDVLGLVELGLLLEHARARAHGQRGPATVVLIDPRHDAQQRRLAGSVVAEDADLRAGEKREPDVVEHAGIGRMNLPEPLHRVDVLHGQAAQYIYCVPFSGRSVSCV